MSNMDVWDWLLLAAGGYVAIVSLARLMRVRRDAILDELNAEAQREKRRQEQERIEQARREKRDRAA